MIVKRIRGAIEMKYYGKINYTIDKEHPDIKYMKDWMEDKNVKF